MDQDFYNNYVRTFTNGNGRPEYTQEVDYGTDGLWHFLLANYATGVYDDIADYDGMSQVDNGLGWSLFETHYTPGPCSNVPSLSMSGLRLHYSHTKDQDWQYASEAGHQYGPFGDCFPPDTGPQGTYYYTINWNTSDYGWFSYTNPS